MKIWFLSPSAVVQLLMMYIVMDLIYIYIFLIFFYISPKDTYTRSVKEPVYGKVQNYLQITDTVNILHGTGGPEAVRKVTSPKFRDYFAQWFCRGKILNYINLTVSITECK